MSENENFEFTFTGDVTDAISSVKETTDSIESIQSTVDELRQSLETLKASVESNPFSQYAKDMRTQFSFAEESLDRIVQLREKIERSQGQREKQQNSNLLQSELRSASSAVEDFQESIDSMHELLSNLGTGMASQFIEGISAFAPRMRIEFGKAAAIRTKIGGTAADEELIRFFKTQQSYQDALSSLRKQNPSLFTDSNMDRYLRGILTSSVAGIHRNRFVDWDNGRHSISNVRELLPPAFSKVSLSKNPVADRTSSRADFGYMLTPQERSAFERILTSNPYIQEEARKANLIAIRNGVAMINKRATRGNINAFAGMIASLFESGARGLPSYGIDDIENPAFLSRIEQKNNKMISNARRVADELSSAYAWLDPGHYASLPAAKVSKVDWAQIGRIKAAPRKTTMEFLEIDMENVGADGSVRMTEGQSQFRYTPVDSSLYQRTLSQQQGADSFVHNGRNRNEIFVSMPHAELDDPRLSEERRKEIQHEIERTISAPIINNGESYEFTGFTPTHAVFTKSAIKRSIEAQDPYFFSNGEVRRTFDDPESFGKAMAYTRLDRTDGRDIRDLYGSDLSRIRVIVADLKKLSGLDGQNFISSGIVPESFQGRQHGGKATYSIFDPKGLFELYRDRVNADGNLVIPGAGINGVDLIIPPDVGLIEDWSNIKTNHQYAGMTQEQIDQARTEAIRRYGISAKTTYSEAETSPRHISAQIANSMAINRDAQNYFQRVFLRELEILDNPSAVIDLLFSGNDKLSVDVQNDRGLLNSPDAQRRIKEYRDSLIERHGRGDILLPRGASNYSMIAAWLPSVLNNAFTTQGIALTEKEARAGLADGVAYFLSDSDEVGLARNPATMSGNVQASNRGADAFFKRLADDLGVDPKGLYVDPASVILKKLQGADEDGDTALVYALRHNEDPEFGKIMAQVLIDSAERAKSIIEASGRTDEDQAKLRASRTKTVAEEGVVYSLDNPEDMAGYYVRTRQAAAKMGAAAAVTRDAYQYALAEKYARALRDAEDHYDIDSNGLAKHMVEWETSKDERDTMYGGSPFAILVSWAQKSRVDSEDGTGTVFDQDAFNARNVDKVNFTSINQGNAVGSALTHFLAAQIYGQDVSGGFNWDSIFASLPNPYAEDSKAGQFMMRMRELRKMQLKGEFLLFDTSLTDELALRARDAYAEIEERITRDSSIENKRAAIEKEYDSIGGLALRNIFTFGLTRKNIDANPEFKAAIEAHVAEYGDSIWGQGQEYFASSNPTSINDVARSVRVKKNQAKADAQKLEEQRQQQESNVDDLVSSFLSGDASEDQKAQVRDSIAKINQLRRERDANPQTQYAKADLDDLINSVLGIGAEMDHYQGAETDQDYIDMGNEMKSLAARIDQIDKQLSLPSYEDRIAAEESKIAAIIPGYKDATAQVAQTRQQIKQKNDEAEHYGSQEKTLIDYMRAISGFSEFYEQANEYSNRLKKNYRSREEKDKGLTDAERLWHKLRNNMRYFTSRIDELAGPDSALPDADKNKLLQLRSDIQQGTAREFASEALALEGSVSNALETSIRALEEDYDPVEEKTVSEFKKRIQKLRDMQIVLSDIGETDSAIRAGRAADSFDLRLEDYRGLVYKKEAETDDRVLRGIAKYTRDRRRRYVDSQFERQLITNESDYDWYRSQKETLEEKIAAWTKRRDDLASEGKTSTDSYITATNEINRLTSALADCQKEMDSLSGVMGVANAGFSLLGQTVSRTISQFGRQMFHQAINEAKQFVMEYDSIMTEIQMVTLKTDEEIGAIGDSLIDMAIDIKAPVSEVTAAATSLYRQGLDENQVNSRLEDVMKFSKTAKVQAGDAIKLITVALSGGMVDSAEEAMDVVSALSDSAATEADQITKGLQKSMSAAKEVGVTYEQLVAMLTVITSKTQLSGSVAGTTMRNIMSRLSRVGSNELIFDENGNAISGSAQAQILRTIDVEMYEDGNLRSAFEILSDVGKQWNSLSDAKKNQIAYALGGTEQFSNVSALMQGFAEVDEYGNNLLEKYLQIAETSGGVTEEKYQHYTGNLAASMSNLQTTFDSLVESIVGAGDAISGFIDFFSSAFEGLSEFNEHTGVITVLGGLAAAVALVAAAFANFPVFIGASIAGAIGLIGNGLKMFYDELEGPSIEEQSGKIDERYGEIQNAINRIREIDNKRVNGVLSDNDAMALKKAFTELDSLGVKCFNTGADLDALAASAEKTKIALDGVESAAKNQSASEKGALLSQLVDDINDYVSEPENVQTELIDVTAPMEKGDGRSILEYAQEYLRYRTLIHSDSDLSEDDQRWLNENRDRISGSNIYGIAAGLFSEFLLGAKVPIDAKVKTTGVNGEIEFDEINDFNSRHNAVLDSVNYPNAELMKYLYERSIDTGYINALLFGNEATPGTDFENQIASILSLQDGVSETGLVNAVAADIAAKINEGYKNWDGKREFDAGQYLYPLYEPNSTRITASSVVAYAYNNTPEAYSSYIKNRSIDPNGVVQFTKQGAVNALYNASQLSESGSNKYALERMYEAFSTASGSSIQEQLENAAFTLLSGTDKGWLNQETLEILMANKEYEDIAKSISQIYETDTEGNVKVKKGVGEAERTKLLEMIVSKYASDTDMRAYRNDAVKRLSAINTFSKLSESENRFGTWQNLSSMDMMEEQMRDDFIEAIGGKETASKYLDGKFNEAGEFYLDRKIGSYGLGVSPLTDEELIDQAEKLLSFIDSNNGNAYPYVEGLPDEMLTDMYGVVDGLKEYVDVMSTEEPFRTKTPDEVQFMRDTVDTNILLNRIPVGHYMQDVVQTVEQLRGSAADQLTVVGNAISQQSKFEQGKYAFNRAVAGVATSDDYSMLATALGEGWNEEEIKKQIQTNEGQKLIQRALLAEMMKFAYVLEEALRQLIPVDSLSLLNSEMDTDQIVDALSGILTEGALTMIQATGAVFDGNGLIIPFDEDSGKTSASTAFKNAGLNYSGASDNYRMLNYFIEALRSKDVVGRKQTIANHIDSNPLSAQEDWESFYSNNPELRIVQSAFENGKLSSDEFLSRIQTLMYPGSEKDADYYSPALSSLFGDIGFEDGIVDWNSVLANYQNMMTTDIGQTFLSDISELEGGTEILLELSEALKEGSIDGERCAEALELITDGMSSRELAKLNKYKKNAEKLEDIYSGISAGGRDAAETILSINERMQDFNNIQWAVDQFETGNRSNKVIDTIVSHFGGDPDDLKKATGDYAKRLSDVFRMSIQDEETQLQDELATATLSMYNESASEIAKITGESIDIGTISVGGVVDISALLNAMSSSSSAFAKNFVSFIQQMSSYGATLTATTDANGENLTFKWDTSNINGSTYKGGYGGGGGSKKSAGDKLIERQGHGHDLYEHQIKMVQFEQTRYENANELGNYGKMLEEEIKIEQAYLPVVEANINALKSELANVKQGTEEWYKLRDAILEAEELYSDISNSIDENTNKLEENQQAILKLHTDLEEMVVEEIELRLDAENEQLDATVSMEDTIFSAIKQRYQDEWDLIKEDIEKKKEALQQEKDLIDERLDARKEAEDEAAKYEELTELKKQLSLIQMDSTRTKDAAELREAIADLEREIGWDIAEKEAENQKNAIQDQIDAYDDFTSKGDEDLSNLLEDANNFSEEVNSVMKLNQEELFNWLKQNVKEYANSLDDAQKQMVKSWEDTYKKMLGITDTYWDEVNAILSSKETFLEYMKQSKEYIYASDDERAQLLYQWEEAYDKWRLAQKNDAKYEHGDSGLGDWSGSEYTDSSSGSGGSGSSGAASDTPSSDIDNAINALGPGVGPFMLYDSNGKNYGRYSQLDRAKSGAQLTAKTNGTPIYVKDSTGRTVAAFNPGGTAIDVSGSNLSSSSDSLPETGWPTSVSGGHGYYYKVTKDGKNVSGSLGGPFTSREAAQAAAAAAAAGVNGKYQTKYFLKGGIADQTGWAWLDGTPQAPERILSAQQTEDFDTLVSVMEDFRNSGVSMDVLRDMMNWSTSIAIPSALSYVGSNAYQGSTANIGDIIVNITEAQIADDRDIDVLADIVGQKFVKEISKQGFNVSRYNF